MKKYFTIIKAFWQRSFTYRFSTVAYRVGEVFEIIVLITMWTIVYGNQSTIKGFTLQEMITYVLVGNLFSNIVRNYLADTVAQDIKEGRLSMFLVRPISYLEYIFSREIGRIATAAIISFLFQSLVIFFFSKFFIYNFQPLYLFIIFIMIVLAFFIELLLSYLIGLIAFWTDEVGGVYSTIDRFKKFFSGGYFPLNILPTWLSNISFFLPFAYSFFIPSQIYLKKFSLLAGLQGIAIQIIWIFLLFWIVKFVWNKGIKRYEGVGI